MNRIPQFRYAITNSLHINRRPAKFLAFLRTVEPISHYCSSGQHSYTRVPLADTNVLGSECSDFKCHTLMVNNFDSHGYIVWLHSLLRHYNCLSDKIYTSSRTHSDMRSTVV